jgi:hypothetical protein
MGQPLTTGVPHVPIAVENAKPGAPNDWPSLGALVRKVWPRPTPLPAAVALPEQSANDGNLTWPGQDAGFLGRAADPWLIDGDPNAPAFHIAGLTPPAVGPPSRGRVVTGAVNTSPQRKQGRGECPCLRCGLVQV